MMAAHARERFRLAEAAGAYEFFGLFFILFEGGTDGQFFFRHTKLLSAIARSPHTTGRKRDSLELW
jgi:hypothetical protein